MKKNTRTTIIAIVIILILALSLFGAIKSKVFGSAFPTDDYRSLSFTLYKQTTGFIEDTKAPIVTKQTIYKNGDFSLEAHDPLHPDDIARGDSLTYADEGCFGGCDDFIINFKLNNGLGLVKNIQMKANENVVVLEENGEVLAYLTAVPTINTHHYAPSEDISETEDFTLLVDKQRRIIGRLRIVGGTTVFNPDGTSYVVGGEGIIGDEGNNPTIQEYIARDWSYHFILNIKKGSMAIDDLELEGTTANMNLNNKLWGGFDGRIVAVATDTFSATNPVSLFSSGNKKIIHGNNSFSLTVTPEIGVTEVALYPILQASGSDLNTLVADDATRYNLETGDLEFVKGNLIDLAIASESSYIKVIDEESVPTQTKQSNQPSNNEVDVPLTDKFKELAIYYKILIVLLVSLILGLISIPFNKSKKVRNYFITSLIIFVAILVTLFSFGVLNIALPEDVESLQRDGKRIYEQLLYDGTPAGDNHANGGTIDGLNCVNQASVSLDGSTPTITQTCTSPRFVITTKGRNAPNGYQDFWLGGGDIEISGDEPHGASSISAINIKNQDISYFRATTRKLIDDGQRTARFETETREYQYDYVNNQWCSATNGGAFRCSANPELDNKIDIISTQERYAKAYNIMFESQYNCNPPADSWLGYQVFTGNSLSLGDFPVNVVSLCPELETTIFNTETSSSRSDRDVIKSLLRTRITRQSYPIPSDEDWGVFFYFNGSKEGLSQRCEEYYDFNDGGCETGQVLFASEEGVIDEVIGGSVTGGTQPETQTTTSTQPETQTTTSTQPDAPSGTQPDQPSSGTETQQKDVTDMSERGVIGTFIDDNPVWAFMIILFLFLAIVTSVLFASRKTRGKKRRKGKRR